MQIMKIAYQKEKNFFSMILKKILENYLFFMQILLEGFFFMKFDNIIFITSFLSLIFTCL